MNRTQIARINSDFGPEFDGNLSCSEKSEYKYLDFTNVSSSKSPALNKALVTLLTPIDHRV